MNAQVVEMLEATIANEHVVLCWFDFEGKRYAGYYQNPPSCYVARERLQQIAADTMEVLELRKTGMDHWHDPHWEGKSFFAEQAPMPDGHPAKWAHPVRLSW